MWSVKVSGYRYNKFTMYLQKLQFSFIRLYDRHNIDPTCKSIQKENKNTNLVILMQSLIKYYKHIIATHFYVSVKQHKSVINTSLVRLKKMNQKHYYLFMYSRLIFTLLSLSTQCGRCSILFNLFKLW